MDVGTWHDLIVRVELPSSKQTVGNQVMCSFKTDFYQGHNDLFSHLPCWLEIIIPAFKGRHANLARHHYFCRSSKLQNWKNHWGMS